jgi:glycosidase
MVFDLKLPSMGWKTSPDRIQKFVKEISHWQNFIRDTDGWGTLLLENHDNPRSISRFGSDATEEDMIRSGKMLAMILGTLSGTLFLFQGQEIGMVNAPRDWGFEELKDVRSLNFYKDAREKYASDPAGLAPALDKFWRTARDHARLPMQWDSSPNAGFCSREVEPWMRVHDAAARNNVQKQEENQSSLLAFWRRMLRLRKEYKELFIYGSYELIKGGDGDIFAFVKFDEKGKGKGKRKRRPLTVVNMSGEMKKWTWDSVPSGFEKGAKLVLSNVDVLEEGWLKPWEGRVYLDDG